MRIEQPNPQVREALESEPHARQLDQKSRSAQQVARLSSRRNPFYCTLHDRRRGARSRCLLRVCVCVCGQATARE